MAKQTKKTNASNSKQSSSKSKVTSAYDDGNTPDIDTKNVIPDEVPRRDGPGGQ